MWLSGTLICRIVVFLMMLPLIECYPRTYSSKFQEAVPLASQQLKGGQYQATIPPKINDPIPQQRQKTVSVNCHDDAVEVVMSTDLFASGIPVRAGELWLGSPSLLNQVSASSCGAVQTGESQLTIFAYFTDCGTKLSVTGDSLIYSNAVVYSPLPSSDGVLRQEGAVIPVQCQYQRRYSVDSAAVAPTWSQFNSTFFATDHLDFSLQLMNDNWQYGRGSNIYFLGDVINLQASVTLANHFPLLLFIDWCVATPTYGVVPSDVKYSFVNYNGCLADSRSLYSRSKFLQRSQGNTLNMQLSAFRFYNFTSNLVFISCYLKAIPAAYHVSSQNRACSFIDGRWQSVDGSDEVCNTCEPSKQTAAEPEQIQPFRITLAPPVKQPYLAAKPRSAGFYQVRPGQSIEPFKTLMRSRQFPYGMSKRGTDSNKDWSKIVTLGPLFLMPKQETGIQSTGFLPPAPAETSAPQTIPVVDELEFKTDKETEIFSPLKKSLVLPAFDLFGPEEGSGFDKENEHKENEWKLTM